MNNDKSQWQNNADALLAAHADKVLTPGTRVRIIGDSTEYASTGMEVIGKEGTVLDGGPGLKRGAAYVKIDGEPGDLESIDPASDLAVIVLLFEGIDVTALSGDQGKGWGFAIGDLEVLS